MQPRETARRVRDFEMACRERGLPITVQRRVLMDAIVRTETHPTADELWELAKARIPGISRTTVYRVLDTFVDLGLVRRLPHPRGATRFDGDVSPHHHAVCTSCENVYDVQEANCAALPPPADLPLGFVIEGCAILFLGTCRDCSGPRN